MDVRKADVGPTLELRICPIAMPASATAILHSRIKSTVRNPPYRAPRLRAVNAFTKALYFKGTRDHEALRIFTTLSGLRRTSCLRARPGAHPIGGFR